MYKWGKVDKNHLSQINDFTPLTRAENKLTKELRRIGQKVDDWYYPRDQSYRTLDTLSKSKLNSLHHCVREAIDDSDSFKKHISNSKSGNFAYLRHKVFKSKDLHSAVCIENAYKKYRELERERPWKSLFPSRDVFPHGHSNWTGLKFSAINHRILFPLALEFFISKRKLQRKHSKLDGLQSRKKMLEVLKRELQHEPELLENVHEAKTIFKAFRSIDNRRLNKFRKLFQHLRSEGWDDGSGLGNTDHLLNLNSGYTHALYLLRKELPRYEFLRQLLNTARWYNEIGELHANGFTHKGSTADKIKNFALSRLLVILASPHGSTKESRQKISDAKQLKLWIENALEINEGYGGIIKPDFTGYHHKGAYMSAYFPQAIHALSLAAYFLHGTSFAISQKHLHTLKEVLKSYFIMSNGYAIPSAVSGAKSTEWLSVVHKILPAYAYLALALSDSPVNVEKDMASIFMKFYKPIDPYVHINLVEGRPQSGSHYVNSIGSISIFKKVYKLAKTSGITEAKSPAGNWVKPFASMSIHRRNDWSVSVKGFSKYVWDYESTVDQNVFGRYQSHGQMQIVNGRQSLDVYDLFSGWDWNKVPGTTSIELSLTELMSADKCRYFSNTTTVGGLYFGKRKRRNGIFVMDFKQPSYTDTTFSFKKSYFFIDDMIVALGSNIKKSGASNRRVITTLFQNKLINQAKISMNDRLFGENDMLNMRLNINQPIMFVDANNNGYFIPARKENIINLKIGKNSEAKKPNGLKVMKRKTYASVVIEHGYSPSNENYEYAVLVNSGAERIKSFQTRMSPWNFAYKPYIVIRQDEVAHIIRIQRPMSIITGYTIFDSNTFLDGNNHHIIRRVNRPCVIMVEERRNYITIAASDPDLRMFDKFVPNSKDIDADKLFNSYSKQAWLHVVFNQNLKLIGRKNRYDTLKKSITDVFKERNEHGIVHSQIKLLLSHGLTSEMKFLRRH